MSAIRTLHGDDGTILHLLPAPPPTLPSVTKRDIEQAWEAAQTATAAAPPARGFRFPLADGAPAELILHDPDAAAWAAAVDHVADLSTARGVSICLRLLGLVELMSRAAWLRGWFSLGGGGAELAPALLQAAACSPLNETGGFDETALRALLPGPRAGNRAEENGCSGFA